MKTTSTYPIIVTDNLEGTVNFYTTVMDYKVKHNLEAKTGAHVIVLSNTNGNEIELIEANDKMPKALTKGLHGLRINVDDIEDAFKEVKEAGCEILSDIIETEISRNLLIRDLNGVNITLMQHIKK